MSRRVVRLAIGIAVIGGATRAGGQSFMSWTDATQAFELDALGSQ